MRIRVLLLRIIEANSKMERIKDAVDLASFIEQKDRRTRLRSTQTSDGPGGLVTLQLSSGNTSVLTAEVSFYCSRAMWWTQLAW